MLDLFIALLMALATPCATEDAAGPCHWDADTRGNGTGTSFLVLPDGDGDDVVIKLRTSGLEFRTR